MVQFSMKVQNQENQSKCVFEDISCMIGEVLSSAAKPGTHFLENNKIIGVFTMLKLCVNKERNM